MKASTSLTLTTFIVISLILFGTFVSSSYAILRFINYQGQITTAEKIPLNDISIKITFKFYDSLTGGNLLWTEEHSSVPVTQGVYNVILGKKTSLLNITKTKTLYLGISIENDPEMTPRQEVTGVIFAIRAEVAATVDPKAIKTEHLANNCVTSEKLANNSITADKLAKNVMVTDEQGNVEIDGMLNLTGFKPNASPLSSATQSGSLYSKVDGVNFNSESTLVNNILLYFKLDEAIIKDSVSLNNGITHNAPMRVPGKIKNARLFDAAKDQYISHVQDALFDFNTGSFSISFWMQADSPEDWSVVMSKANDWGDNDEYLGWVFGNAGGKNGTGLEFTINSGNSGDKNNNVIQADNVFNGQWHHVVGMRDEHHTMRLYVDGKIKGEITGVSQTVNSDATFLIGKLIVDPLDNAVNYNYSGLVDDIAIWDRALTESEISELYQHSAGIPSTDSKLIYQTGQKKYVVNDRLQYSAEDICDGSIEGIMRYNAKSKIIEYCNGSEWRPTFSMKNDGQTQYSAGHSCKGLLDAGYSKGDGVYWIDPDGDNDFSNAFKVYCDMRSHGGGWTLVLSAGLGKDITGPETREAFKPYPLSPLKPEDGKLFKFSDDVINQIRTSKGSSIGYWVTTPGSGEGLFGAEIFHRADCEYKMSQISDEIKATTCHYSTVHYSDNPVWVNGGHWFDNAHGYGWAFGYANEGNHGTGEKCYEDGTGLGVHTENVAKISPFHRGWCGNGDWGLVYVR